MSNKEVTLFELISKYSVCQVAFGCKSDDGKDVRFCSRCIDECRMPSDARESHGLCDPCYAKWEERFEAEENVRGGR